MSGLITNRTLDFSSFLSTCNYLKKGERGSVGQILVKKSKHRKSGPYQATTWRMRTYINWEFWKTVTGRYEYNTTGFNSTSRPITRNILWNQKEHICNLKIKRADKGKNIPPKRPQRYVPTCQNLYQDGLFKIQKQSKYGAINTIEK